MIFERLISVYYLSVDQLMSLYNPYTQQILVRNESNVRGICLVASVIRQVLSSIPIYT